jgi:hypothetical protein
LELVRWQEGQRLGSDASVSIVCLERSTREVTIKCTISAMREQSIEHWFCGELAVRKR